MSAVASRVPLASALCETLAFVPEGAPVGNLALGMGTLGTLRVHVALLENRQASGSVGQAEAESLAQRLRLVERERALLVLFLDSAGAKVSEGLRALAAFRTLYRAALDASLAGAPLAALLGRNCFGGASMLAHLAPHRMFSPGTQLAMSGPSVLASATGTTTLDEMFRAMADAALASHARAAVATANTVWEEGSDLRSWLTSALVPRSDPVGEFQRTHEALGSRLPKPGRLRSPEPVHRRDFERLFPEGRELLEFDGLVTGTVRRDARQEPVLGLVARTPVGAERAWHFANEAWRLVPLAPARLNVVLDCESHAARLDDERIVLSEYIAGMSQALAALSSRGTRVELTILGRAGGGVYVALAAPAAHVAVEHGAQVQVLPGAAVRAILGEDRGEAPPASESVAAGVADEEIRLGLLGP